MAADNLLQRWAIFVDGVGKAGNAKEYNPPPLEVKTVDFQAGDMDAPIPVDDGMAVMEASFSIAGIDVGVLQLMGLRQGGSVPMSVRSSYTNAAGDGWDLVEELRGMITKVERDAQGTDSQRDKNTKYTMKLAYYKVSKGSERLVEIDPVNHVRYIGGVDQLQQMRTLLKVS